MFLKLNSILWHKFIKQKYMYMHLKCFTSKNYQFNNMPLH